MEKKTNQLKTIAIALASITALSVFFFARSRRRRNHNCPQSRCYLQGDHRKPQYEFKRVPADNSYSPFKHLSLKDSNDDKSWNSYPYEVEIGDLVESLKIEFEWIAIEKNADLKMGESYVWVETESELSH